MEQIIQRYVSQHGDGDFLTVQEAIDSVQDEAARIIIASGEYVEKIVIPRGKPPITLLGEDVQTTTLVFGDNAHTLGSDGKPIGTFRSSSLFVYADGFTMENMTVANSSGAGSGQAVAAFMDADRMTCRNVRFLGDQDTLYTGKGRQYYIDCYIEGDVDFIFGPANAVFEHCHIHCKRTGGYVTAASTPEEQEHGYTFLDCRITGGEGVHRVYLGRPWRPYAKVVFIRTELGNCISPAGWHNWGDLDKQKTSRYEEFGSVGLGANDLERVSWAKLLDEREASAYTLQNILSGDDGWTPGRIE